MIADILDGAGDDTIYLGAEPSLPIVLGGAQAEQAASAAADGLVFVVADAESVGQVVAAAVSAGPAT